MSTQNGAQNERQINITKKIATQDYHISYEDIIPEGNINSGIVKCGISVNRPGQEYLHLFTDKTPLLTQAKRIKQFLNVRIYEISVYEDEILG
jgi:hypothetical protein